MTTIAFDGKSLAADTQSTSHNFRFSSQKLHRLPDGRLFAASGGTSDCEAVLAWLLGGPKPKVKDFCALLVDQAGKCWRYEDKLVPFVVTSPFHAIGSGREFAVASMHLGKTAKEAVEIASLFDVYTGGPVDSLPIFTQPGDSEK